MRRRTGVLPDDASYREWLASRATEKQKLLNALLAEGLLPGWFPRSAREIPELTGELHNAIIGFLAATPSMLLAINQEDLTKEIAQQNLPGTTWQYPNWSRKMHFRLDELYSARQATDFAQMFRQLLEVPCTRLDGRPDRGPSRRRLLGDQTGQGPGGIRGRRDAEWVAQLAAGSTRCHRRVISATLQFGRKSR